MTRPRPAITPPWPSTGARYEDRRVRLCRRTVPGGTVVCKQPLGPDHRQRLAREREALRRLAGLPGVVQLVDDRADSGDCPDGLQLRDLSGDAMSQLATPVPAVDVPEWGLRLAQVVAQVHQRGVINRALRPSAILLAEPDQWPVLIDFQHATVFAELRPEFSSHTGTEKVPTYLAPEQTGRTGRPVDQRADLYALGAILYELATGSTPFDTTDPLRLSHAHLTSTPAPPIERRPELPPALSAIIMRLLQAEPDERYQTAEGLAYDLSNLERMADGAAIGQRDFPLRLRSPSKLVGREAERAALAEALAGADSGQCRAVVVSGEYGVGKSALVEELRAIATASNGWFIAGRFDKHRRDPDFDAVRQAFRSLARLLLGEPEEELAELRSRLRATLGDNAGLLAAVVPEFAAVLRVPPSHTTGDPLTAEARVQRAGVEALRVIGSPKRPVAMVLDDLQWAARTPLGFIDMVVNDQSVRGVLLACTYQESDLNPTHPLSVILDRWQRDGLGVRSLRLGSLRPDSTAALVAETLRMDIDQAESLTRAILPYSHGNPYHTVELLNSLRHRGLLRPGVNGWEWDPIQLRLHLDRENIADLLAQRVDAMPEATRTLLRTMACLGSRVEIELLRVATEPATTSAGSDQIPEPEPEQKLEQVLEPALAEGLVVLEPGQRDAVRFRHDRAQDAVLRRLEPRELRRVQLRLARTLAAWTDRKESVSATEADLEWLMPAADQYLAVLESLTDPQERRRVAQLLRRAAAQAQLLSSNDLVERYLSAALLLLPVTDQSRETLITIQGARHTALFGLGRLSEADQIYQDILRLTAQPIERVPPTLIQISSLTFRNRFREAHEIGLYLLRLLGHSMPEDDQLDREIAAGLTALREWLDTEPGEPARDERPEITNPRLIAIGSLLNRLISPAYFVDLRAMAWLSLSAWSLWVEHGPSASLVGPVTQLGLVTIARGDFQTGRVAARRVLAVSDSRGYEPATSHARSIDALLGCWSEPVEHTTAQAHQARQGLIHAGDLQFASYTYTITVYNLFEWAPTLTEYLPELEAAIGFATRLGDELSTIGHLMYAQLIRALRGEGSGRAGLPRPNSYPSNLSAQVGAHTVQALAAILFGDPAALARHSKAAMEQAPGVLGLYASALIRVLRAVSLAEQARSGGSPGEDLDQIIDWIAARAADAPENFEHLLRLVEAERAWTAGDFRAAAYAFDAAQHQTQNLSRPWHRALILERGARFYLAHGMEHVGRLLLQRTRQAYQDWGATAKVEQLDWAYPGLRADGDPGATAAEAAAQEGATGPPAHRAAVTAGTIDLLGILSVSQALSSETSLAGLRTRVGEALLTMTGATAVHLLFWDEEQGHWLVNPTEPGQRALSLDNTRPGEFPATAIRYAERTREPLVVEDAVTDDRFSRDPYFADIDRCSLLAAPVLGRGRMRAMLLLENRLIRGAFSPDRLDGIMMIGSQLAVSIDNALVYSSLERRVAERTEELAHANRRLAALSVTDALTGLANRRRLEEVLSAEWLRGQRSGDPLSIAMVDIDNFKEFNDRYGHAAGDTRLQQVASVLREQVRDLDLVARYGGEEFAIVMPATDLRPAIQVAERLRNAVRSADGRAEPGDGGAGAVPTTADDGAASQTTISIGVATMTPTRDQPVEELIDRADIELYRAKRDGRDQVQPVTVFLDS